MSQLKIASFNAEWMICIFGGTWKEWNGKIPKSFPGEKLGDIKLPKIDDVPDLCKRIAGVIQEINPLVKAKLANTGVKFSNELETI